MIRILLVDDHPAMRTGLTAVLEAEPGLVPLAAAASEDELPPAFNRTKPDVVVLDYHLPSSDGLAVCRLLKHEIPAPAVLLYSAYADAALAVPAILAGADGILHKSASAAELYNAIRTVARGDRVMPPLPRELIAEASGKLDSADLPILGMTLDGSPMSEIASVLRRDPREISARIDAMIRRLRVEVVAPARA